MKTTVNKIVPHEDKPVEVLSEVRSLAINKAFEGHCADQIDPKLRLTGSDLRFRYVWEWGAVRGTSKAV